MGFTSCSQEFFRLTFLRLDFSMPPEYSTWTRPAQGLALKSKYSRG